MKSLFALLILVCATGPCSRALDCDPVSVPTESKLQVLVADIQLHSTDRFTGGQARIKNVGERTVLSYVIVVELVGPSDEHLLSLPLSKLPDNEVLTGGNSLTTWVLAHGLPVTSKLGPRDNALIPFRSPIVISTCPKKARVGEASITFDSGETQQYTSTTPVRLDAVPISNILVEDKACPDRQIQLTLTLNSSGNVRSVEALRGSVLRKSFKTSLSLLKFSPSMDTTPEMNILILPEPSHHSGQVQSSFKPRPYVALLARNITKDGKHGCQLQSSTFNTGLALSNSSLLHLSQ